MFKFAVLASSFAMPIHAGFIGTIVGAPFGAAFLGISAVTGLRAYDQCQKARSKTGKAGLWADRVTNGEATKLESELEKKFGTDSDFLIKLNEKENELNRTFGKYTTTAVYGVTSLTCLIIGARLIL